MNKDKIGIIQFLLTGDVSQLPEEFAQIDIKRWNKKTDLQKAREIKRIISSIINELKITTN